MKSGNTSKTWRIAFAVTLLALGLLIWLLWDSGFFQAVRSIEELHHYIQQFSPYSHLAFFLLQLASVILAPIPSNVTTAAGGLLFGTLPSFLISSAAVILGSVIIFQLGRAFGKPFAERFISSKSLAKYGDILNRKRDIFLFLAFLFPFFPDDLICIMAGLTDIPFRRFFLLVVIARPWGLLAASAVGGSVLQIPLWGMVLLGVGGLLLFLLALRYGDRFEETVIEKLKHS